VTSLIPIAFHILYSNYDEVSTSQNYFTPPSLDAAAK
jgi:heme-binding NEAT domain protein